MSSQNGTQMDQYLKQIIISRKVHLKPGLCSAVNKRVFMNTDDTSAPKYSNSFFTHPVSDDDDTAENNYILKLAVQTKYSDTDVILLTKMHI